MLCSFQEPRFATSLRPTRGTFSCNVQWPEKSLHQTQRHPDETQVAVCGDHPGLVVCPLSHLVPCQFGTAALPWGMSFVFCITMRYISCIVAVFHINMRYVMCILHHHDICHVYSALPWGMSHVFCITTRYVMCILHCHEVCHMYSALAWGMSPAFLIIMRYATCIVHWHEVYYLYFELPWDVLLA